MIQKCLLLLVCLGCAASTTNGPLESFANGGKSIEGVVWMSISFDVLPYVKTYLCTTHTKQCKIILLKTWI